MEPCCEDLDNRSAPKAEPDRPDLVMTTCLVCGRRHFELAVDPVHIGVKFGDDK